MSAGVSTYGEKIKLRKEEPGFLHAFSALTAFAGMTVGADEGSPRRTAHRMTVGVGMTQAKPV